MKEPVNESRGDKHRRNCWEVVLTEEERELIDEFLEI